MGGGRTPSAKQYLHEYSEVVAPDRSFWKLENIQRSWDKLTRGEGGLMVEFEPHISVCFQEISERSSLSTASQVSLQFVVIKA